MRKGQLGMRGKEEEKKRKRIKAWCARKTKKKRKNFEQDKQQSVHGHSLIHSRIAYSPYSLQNIFEEEEEEEEGA